VLGYIAAATDADGLETQWRGEKKLRNRLRVEPHVRDSLEEK
jgi:hypothetical protein